MRQIAILAALFAVQCAFAAGPVFAAADRIDDVERVVAISDIHGAYDAMVATLTNAKILGEQQQWVGGESQLVIVGDILDRGPRSRDAMDLLMRLEAEASAAGGRVHVLIGNHEAMILTGDMRYVSKQEYAAFADEAEVADRERWYALFAERNGTDNDALRTTFEKKFPPGYFAMRRAFRPDGQYGRWLLSKKPMVVLNRTVYVHGGLSPLVTELGLEATNAALQSELADYAAVLASLMDDAILLPTDSHYDYESILRNHAPALDATADQLQTIKDGIRLSNSALLSVDGPLWYRNHVECPRMVEEHRLEAALASVAADRVVIGHTPTPAREVQQRFGGRVVQIDTGMLNFYYKGIGHALIIEGDSMTVVDQNGALTSDVASQARDVGDRPGRLGAEALASLLRSGEILSTVESDDGQKRTLVKVSDGTATVTALFMKPQRRGFYPNVAAYRLDRLLELDMVPVSVIRELDGKSGSLQFLPDNQIDEAERVAGGKGGGAWCSIEDQWPEMYVFDVLIYNEGRSQHRMLYDTSSWRLMLSEHERAFSTKKGRPAHLRNASIVVHDGWRDGLKMLTDEALQTTLSDVLDKRRIAALQQRRDDLLAISRVN